MPSLPNISPVIYCRNYETSNNTNDYVIYNAYSPFYFH